MIGRGQGKAGGCGVLLERRIPAPKPVTLPAGQLHDALGVREVSYTRGQSTLALKERTLQ